MLSLCVIFFDLTAFLLLPINLKQKMQFTTIQHFGSKQIAFSKSWSIDQKKNGSILLKIFIFLHFLMVSNYLRDDKKKGKMDKKKANL